MVTFLEFCELQVTQVRLLSRNEKFKAKCCLQDEILTFNIKAINIYIDDVKRIKRLVIWLHKFIL